MADHGGRAWELVGLVFDDERLAALDPAENARAAAQEDVEKAQAEAVYDMTRPGIYAFSYGWYLEHPDDHDRYLVKVGRAGNVRNRLAEHRAGAKTHLPEPLALLRVYFVDDVSRVEALEKSFHNLLTHAGHKNPRFRAKVVGTEWFATTAEFLDAVAEAVGIDKGMYVGGSDFA
ncbi:MAG: GIY-YIG nuclease family protein [Promicromonosporaceae bacterium]|nr:GIY-YIG nuclease family protein [Promicromonosporaceae bacterium]